MESSTIKSWPSQERPREKLIAKGAASLSDAELLAIFLRTGVPGCSAVELARQLLQRFGGLRSLLETGLEEFCEAHGLGPAKYVQLQAVLEMGRRHLREQLQRESVLSSPQLAGEFLCAQLRHRPHEVFACLFLDTQHRVIAFEELFRGTLDGASVYPREVLKRALALNAAAVIFAHNHPSGISEPSQADRAITERLRSALALVDIRVLDHMIIGDGRPLSFAERGLL